MWVIFPVLAACAYAVSAFLQNHITDRVLPGKRAGAYILTQLLSFGAAMLILYGIWGRSVFMLPLDMVVGLVLAGVVNVVGSVMYFRALRSGDTIEVTIFGEAAPLIALALGVVFLGETVDTMQAMGFAAIMVAAGILIFSTKRKRNGKMNLTTVGWAFVSAFFWVLGDIIFVGVVGRNEGNLQYFGQTFFYFEMGSFLTALIGLVCIPSWRKAVTTAFFGERKAKNLAVTLLDNGLYTVGEFCFKLGLLMAPAVALMSVVAHAVQLGVVFVLGIFLSRIFPRFMREKYSRKLLLQHLVAVLLAVTGIILLG